jgi:FlaA1/EpsC-like NDP-sugar epimerase
MFPGPLSIRRYNMERIRRRILAYSVDLAAFACSALIAFELRFDGAVPAAYIRPMGMALCLWAALKWTSFLVCRVSWGNWRHTSAYDVVRVIAANTVGSLASGVGIVLLLGSRSVPHSVYIIDWMVCCFLTVGGRLAIRGIVNTTWSKQTEGDRTRTLIYGAGSAGQALLHELLQNQNLMSEVIGLVDDDLRKADLKLLGKRVLGTGKSIGALVRKHGINVVLIAIPSATGQDMVRILKYVLDAEVKYKMVPGLGELIQSAELGKQIRDVSVEDLLGRKHVQLDQERIRERIHGRVVMVTGAAGSIGSEICRQIASFHPRALVGFDEAETPLFQIDRELRHRFPKLIFHPEIGSITRPDTLQRVMRTWKPSIVYHAAAYKHVPMMEKHVFAAVENNIFGTWEVALAAIKSGVEDFVMISTDKAVRPTSMMGATKRMAELVIRALQQESKTKFVSVRFGNVLGSNGSVVPIFKEQIAAGGPVTVTHPEMRRYFMTISEAAQLVLQAFAIGKGGEVFELDMGESVKIVDLARNLILLSGLQPDRDIEIQFSGVRPGEKLYEEANLKDEHLVPTSHTKIRSFVCPQEVDLSQVRVILQELRNIIEDQDVARLVHLLKRTIPDYSPSSKVLENAMLTDSFHAFVAASLGASEQADSHAAAKFGPAFLTN